MTTRKPKRDESPCRTCGSPTVARWQVCRSCRDAVALTGGGWVPTGHGTVVWQAGA